MLQGIRDKTRGWVAWVVVGLIGCTFVLWGIGDHFSTRPGSKAVATVNGAKVTEGEVEALYDRLQRQQTYQNPEAEIDSVYLKQMALKNLIENKVLTQVVERSGFGISDQQLREIIASLPEFQENGVFSQAKFAQLLHAFAYNEASFLSELRNNILITQMQQGIVDSNFSLDQEVASFVRLIDQKRDISYTIIPAAQFVKQLSVTPEEIEKYYQSHTNDFYSEPKVAVEYIALNKEDLKKKIVPTAEALQQYYQKNIAHYTTPGRITAAHILIAVPENAEEAQLKEVQSKLEDIQKQLKSGEKFSNLAKKYSDDTGSAVHGGQLAPFTKGDMVAEFEKAAFALTKPGELSEPVRSKFGFHIIQLISNVPEKILAFNAVHAQVESEYITQQSEENLSQVGDEIATLAFEHPDSLQAIADKFQLKIQSTPVFAESAPVGLFKAPKIAKLVFSEEIVQEKHNSELIKLDDDHYIVFRAVQYEPAIRSALGEVKADIQKYLIADKTQKQAKLKAEAVIAKLIKGESFDKAVGAEGLIVTSIQGLQRKQVEQSKYYPTQKLNGLDPIVAQAAFALPKNNKNINTKPYSTTPVLLPNGDVALVQVNHIEDGSDKSLTKEENATYKQGLAASMGQIEFNLLVSTVLKSANIKNHSGKPLDLEKTAPETGGV